MTVAAYRWTLEQYHQAVDAGVFDDQHVELLNGELVTMASEGEIHAGQENVNADYLRSLLGKRAQIRTGNPITLPDSISEPEPDIAIVEPRYAEYRSHHPYPDNIYWLIELANTSLKKDVEIKDKVYAAVGIQEYWVVNLPAERLVVFRDPLDGEYQSKQTYTTGTISPLAFADVVVSIDILLGLDEWSP
jgi:Uma2 family endonuclease